MTVCFAVDTRMGARPLVAVAMSGRPSVRAAVVCPEQEPEPVWGWADLTPPDLATTYNTTGQPRAVGMTMRVPNAHTPGTVDAIAFWRAATDPTTSRHIGLWKWDGVAGVVRHRSAVSEGESGEGWVRLDVEPLTINPSTADSEFFVVLAEVPVGSGFYWSTQGAAPGPVILHGQPTGQAGPMPSPTQWPTNFPAGIPATARPWVDVRYRPRT